MYNPPIILGGKRRTDAVSGFLARVGQPLSTYNCLSPTRKQKPKTASVRRLPPKKYTNHQFHLYILRPKLI